MKWLNFRIVLYIFIIFCPVFVSAQEKAYEERIERYKAGWNSLIPSYIKAQYAGSMGIVSLGTGWDYGKNNQWETDVFLGLVPKYDTDRAKFSFTLKQNFIPWKKNIRNSNIIIEPFACGLYMNTIFGSEFWSRQPDKYPNGYYDISTKVRTNVYIGQRFIYNIPSDRRNFGKSLTFFYEISTNDLYVISAVGNSYLKPTDYLHLSLGLKYQLF